MNLDTITFAWPADGRTTLAKIIRVQGRRIVGKEPSPNVKSFRYVERPVHDLRGLFSEVRRAAARGAIAIRAKPKGLIGNRRIHLTDGIEPWCEVVPRRWCAFDWDDLPLELQPCPNPKWSWEPHPLLEPWIGAQIALRRLPPAFRDVSCFWQVSAGAGFNEGFRLRTWHWRDHPVTGAELKVWLKPALDRGLVDVATLVEVQPHYLAVRVVGGSDPCPRRFGMLRLARDVVPVPDLLSIKRRQEEIEQEKREKRRGSTAQPPGAHPAAASLRKHGIEPGDGNPVLADVQARIDECIAAVKIASARHTTYRSEAGRAKALADKYDLDWPKIKEDLIAAYESKLTHRERRDRRWFSTEGVMEWLESRSVA